jgi:hypothetical protein
MKASAVYRKAAEWMDRQPADRHILAYACMQAAPEDPHTARCYHLRKWLGNEYIDSEVWGVQQARVLALLLMAEISRDEE